MIASKVKYKLRLKQDRNCFCDSIIIEASEKPISNFSWVITLSVVYTWVEKYNWPNSSIFYNLFCRDVFGSVFYHELKKDGDEIYVVQDNKKEFVDLYSNFLLNQGLNFFGFSECI